MKISVAFYNRFFDEETVSSLQTFCSQVSNDKINLITPAVFGTEDLSVIQLLEELCKIAKQTESEAIIYSWSDCPFLNVELTKELIELHTESKAEYSFVDGYPVGLTPEIIDCGTLNILLQLAKADEKNATLKVKRTSIFDLLKKDINSFEVETLISDKDFRLSRLEFCNGTKSGRLLCDRLSAIVQGKNLTATEMCTLAEKESRILHLLPAFYNIQISSKCHGSCDYCPYPNACKQKYGIYPHEFDADSSAIKTADTFMDFAKFKNLIAKISDFSETAVISLSLWGEPLLHPQFVEFVATVLQNPGFSVLIETSGTDLAKETADKIKTLVENAPKRTNNYPPIIWICSFDAFTEQTYCKLHKNAFVSFAKMNETATILESLFGEVDGVKSVYRQFVRVNENEDELEPFFRTWNNRLIQKYDNFQNRLPYRKPADLTPVKRYPCWHLRRDLSILIDGSVPLCREHLFDNIIGNAFLENLADIWQKSVGELENHIKCEYKGLCADCDEYYTFNF